MTDVWKTYPGGVTAVKGVTLSVEEGELVVLLGPSGCGKSTILRLIAGLEEMTGGTIELSGEVLNNVPERRRDIAMVFQNYALYPHMTVAGNIAYPLKHRGVPRRERAEHVQRVASMLELQDVLGSKPAALSGGQRQRVAMGRAMVREPRLFLLDEPMSNLDAALRVQMRTEIHTLQRRLGVGMIFVTHDQTEAMTLGDRVAVMRHGELQQLGPPAEVYNRPRNVFVAGFMGSPGMTLFETQVVDDDGLSIAVGEDRISIDQDELRSQPAVAERVGQVVIAGIRAEDLTLATLDGLRRTFRAELRFQEQLGSSLIAYFAVHGLTRGGAVDDALEQRLSDDSGARQALGLRPPHIIPGRFSADTRISVGSPVELGIQAGKLRFFDAATGEAL